MNQFSVKILFIHEIRFQKVWFKMSIFLRFCLFLPVFLCFSSLFGQPGINDKQVAIDHIRKGAYMEALENLNRAIQREPAYAELYFLRGYAKYGLDDFLGAELDYTRSVELSPYLPDVYTNRAIVRSQLLNFTGAMEDFNKAISMDEKNGEIYFHRARANLYLKKYYSCIVDCNTAIHLGYKEATVYILRANSEQAIKRYTEALDDLGTARKINPLNGYIFTQRGLVWIDLEQVDSAIADFSRALELDSVNTYACFNRALAYLKKNDRVLGLKDLNTVIRLSPYNSYAYYNRAIVLIGLDEKRGAIHDFEIVSKLDPKNIISYYYRSKLKSDLRDYRGALEDLNKTLELLPDYTDAWYDRYEVKLKLGDQKGAQQDYRKAVELMERNHYDRDSLMITRKDYLQSLVKLSGDFEEMNTLNSKFQNQAVDIRMLPLFYILIWKTDFDKVRLYDVYGKPNYFSTVLTVSNQIGLISDSVLRHEIAIQTQKIDSARPNTGALFRRGVALALLGNHERAIRDFDSVLLCDTTFVAAWFFRAYARLALLNSLNIQENFQEEITIGKPAPKLPRSDRPEALEHTYEIVLNDLNRVTYLDPEFAAAWYNRGCVNSMMGNYREAIGDFSAALEHDPLFAEAYYNRGLMNILTQENHKGCGDLSKAGELGIADAYRVMKRYCYK